MKLLGLAILAGGGWIAYQGLASGDWMAALGVGVIALALGLACLGGK